MVGVVVVVVVGVVVHETPTSSSKRSMTRETEWRTGSGFRRDISTNRAPKLRVFAESCANSSPSSLPISLGGGGGGGEEIMVMGKE